MKVDYVVVGGGIAGTCAAYHLAAEGRETLLIERGAGLAPMNPVSSSGDNTKCFRSTYGGDRNMTRLCKASFEWWRRFEEESGVRLFTPCGLLALAAEDAGALTHWRSPEAARFARDSAPIMESEGLPFEVLSKAAVTDRFPQLRACRTYDHAILDQSAGLLDAATAVRAIGDLAARHGALIWTDTTVEKVVRDGARVVTLVTNRGDIEVGESLILAAGYMNLVLAPELRPKVRITRQQVFYFRAGEQDCYLPASLPIVIDLNTWRYVFPAVDGLVKVADDDNQLPHKAIDPSMPFDHRADDRFEEDARRFLQNFVPGLAGSAAHEGRACLYANTASEQYLIYPRGNTVVVSACSGHGFKNGPMTGLIAARLACGRECDWYFDAFRFENATDLCPTRNCNANGATR